MGNGGGSDGGGFTMCLCSPLPGVSARPIRAYFRSTSHRDQVRKIRIRIDGNYLDNMSQLTGNKRLSLCMCVCYPVSG